MLSYLFLLAAVAVTPELPITDTMTTDEKEIQHLVSVVAQEVQLTANTATQPTKEQKTEAALPPVMIINTIEPSMLEYKHWTGKYSPEIFTVSVNGTEIATGATCEVSADNSTIEVGYTYSFMNGMRTGGKKISYQLNENITQAHITFDWKNDWRIIVDNGKAIKEIVS